MDIGKPRRIYRVEPVKEPVPAKREPKQDPPATTPTKPEEVPAR